MVYGVIYVNTTCLNLSEALSECETTDLNPRLRSLRSLSLGLLESQPLRGCEVSIQRVVSDTDILFSVWSLTVPCGLHSLVLPLRGSEWTLSFLSAPDCARSAHLVWGY